MTVACADMLFMDVLPEDVYDNVLRFLSRFPDANNWESYVPLRLFSKLLSVRAGVGRGLKTRFDTLCISKCADLQSEHEKYSWKLRPQSMAWTNDVRVARQFIMAGGGQSITTLIVGDGMYGKSMHGVDMVSDFHAHLPSVNSLSVLEPGGVWVSKFGPQLEVLEMACIGVGGLLAVRKYCTRLRELKLHGYISDYFLKSNALLSDASARTLESLTIVGKFHLPIERIQKIQEKCRGLKRIRIYSDQGAVANLLASYGEQLEWAYLHEFQEEHIRTVANACNNARFEAFNPELLPALNILGESLEKVTSFIRNEGVFMNEDSAVWNRCVNLRHLKLWGSVTIEQLEAVMNAPKPFLKVVSVQLPRGSTADYKEAARRVCKEACVNAREIEIWCFPHRF